jgi:hypothetical protein
MNLKELGVLLLGLYVITSILIAYKYFIAKGGVYRISRVLVFKYILRFFGLLILLFLTYTTLVLKQRVSVEQNNKPNILVAVSSNCSNQTWDDITTKVVEMSPNGAYQLVVYDQRKGNWQSFIPATNRESFVSLVAYAKDLKFVYPKRNFEEKLNYKPSKDQFGIFTRQRNQWVIGDLTSSSEFFLSKNYFNSWTQTAYVPLYLVILLLLLVFIDVVFPTKGIKI